MHKCAYCEAFHDSVDEVSHALARALWCTSDEVPGGNLCSDRWVVGCGRLPPGLGGGGQADGG